MSTPVMLAVACTLVASFALGDPLPDPTVDAIPVERPEALDPGLREVRSGLEKSAGGLVASVAFSEGCASLGVGIAFDGENLWFTCANQSPDLFRADPRTGVVLESYSIVGGLGAIAYDCTDNSILCGWASGGDPRGSVRKINLDANQDVLDSSVLFMAGPLPAVNGLIDGIAVDVTTDPRKVYLSHDGARVVRRYLYDGTPLDGSDTSPWTGPDCVNSGLAIGGDDLYQGSNGCSHVWVHPKEPWPMTGPNAFDFSTRVPGDPNFRDEGLACDSETFGVDVMWSIEAYEPRRAHAFEIPAGSCETCAVSIEPCDRPRLRNVGAALRVEQHGDPAAPDITAVLDWSRDEGAPRALGTGPRDHHYHVLRGILRAGTRPLLLRVPGTEPWLDVRCDESTPRARQTPLVHAYVIRPADACENEGVD